MEFIPYILGVTESTEPFISASTTATTATRAAWTVSSTHNSSSYKVLF